MTVQLGAARINNPCSWKKVERNDLILKSNTEAKGENKREREGERKITYIHDLCDNISLTYASLKCRMRGLKKRVRNTMEKLTPIILRIW